MRPFFVIMRWVGDWDCFFWSLCFRKTKGKGKYIVVVNVNVHLDICILMGKSVDVCIRGEGSEKYMSAHFHRVSVYFWVRGLKHIKKSSRKKGYRKYKVVLYFVQQAKRMLKMYGMAKGFFSACLLDTGGGCRAFCENFQGKHKCY